MEEKTIQIKQIGYKIKGEAQVKDYYGNIGKIDMTDFIVDNIDKTEEEWFALLNDSGYGAESILGGRIEIYELYEENVIKHIKSLIIKDFKDE